MATSVRNRNDKRQSPERTSPVPGLASCPYDPISGLGGWSGFAGYAARGIMFLPSSYFLFQAGLEGQASEACGTAKALSWLSSPWDILVALGLSALACSA
jgi:hypothetical protein